MEGGGLDFFGAAGKPTVSDACRAEGARRIVFSTDADVLVLNRAQKSSEANRGVDFAPGGLVVTDAPAVHVVHDGGSRVTSLPAPEIHREMEGCDGVAHLRSASNVPPWDLLVDVPAARRAACAEALQQTFGAEAFAAATDTSALVSLHYPWVSDELKARLGVVVRGEAKAVRGRWRDEHKATHTRKRNELEALRARSRSRSQPKKRDGGGGGGGDGGGGGGGGGSSPREEEEQRRLARAREAAERLEDQQRLLQEERGRRELEAAAKAAAARRAKEAEAEEVQARKAAADERHLAEVGAARERESEVLEAQRKARQEADRVAAAERQEKERSLQEKKEQLCAERVAAEEAHRDELAALKARREEEEAAKRAEALLRYEQSQVHRTERQVLSRAEASARLELLREEASLADALRGYVEEVATLNALSMQTHAWEKLEGVGRAGVEHRWAEELGDLEWHFARQYAHVCEVGRRRLMEEEERARRLVQAREEAEVARAMDRYLKAIEDAEAAPGLADALGSDEEDDDDDDLPSPESPSPGQERRRVTVAAGVGEVLYYDDGDDDGSPHRGTQTPSYGYVGGDGGAGGGGGDARISAELQKLRKELHHERELRERATERMSEHERVMKQRSSQLEDRERRLLEKLSKDHASRLEEVRTVLQPRVEKAAAFDEADRVLRVMNEREAEWADRERAWTLLQAEMDAEARRLRDELARASQLHWQAEEEKAELKGRSDANDVEMAAMRNTIDRADDRLRHVLLEEQELLCKVEEQWKARCDAAEAELAEAEAKAARRLDERERQMLRQERALRQRCESAEKDRLEMLGRLETLQVRGEAAERERRSLRDELGAEAHLAGHRATAEVRAARSALDRERRLRAEAEEALGAAQRELERLGTQLEDARLRRTQQHREAQLAAAEHEAELARAQALVPDRATRFSILAAVETAARYATISQHNEGLTDLLHHFYRGYGGGGPRRGASASLAEHNGMLRELLALEEAKVAELERAVAEVRRQRNELAGQVQHPAGFFDAQARVVLAEAEARAGVEAACRAALVDCLTTRRRGNAPSPQPPPPPQTPQLPTPLAARVEAPLQPPPDPSAACHGWLLACLETPSFGGRGFQRTQWKQLYVWVDHADGLLRYSPVAGGEAGAAAGGQPVGSVDLRNVVAVEIEMFTDPSEQPPPVSRYQQLGFYVEMGVSGAKHRFCASSVPERTAWLDHVRRTVLKHSSVWSARWDPAHTPPQSVAAAASPPQTLRSAVRSHSRERRLRKPVFLEHLSYLSMED